MLHPYIAFVLLGVEKQLCYICTLSLYYQHFITVQWFVVIINVCSMCWYQSLYSERSSLKDTLSTVLRQCALGVCQIILSTVRTSYWS